MRKTLFTSLALVAVLAGIRCTTSDPPEISGSEGELEAPNIIILFADDLGYGDLSSYGHPAIKTPNLDTLASQGLRFTSYMAASWCVPSRTQLLTGRYMPRVDFGGGTGADGTGGLPDREVTLAEGLKKAGYATGMAGKWHLGYQQNEFLPVGQGFDSWLGLPYSNDYMKPFVQTEEPMVMYRDSSIVDRTLNQDSLTVTYTEEILRFIQQHGGERPFFFYLAYNMPHLPIHTTEEFRGRSGAGLYGDVVETIDWSVGQVMKSLEDHKLTDNTIVFFASDNGPWLNLPDRMLQKGNRPWHQGTTGPLRGYKHTTFEGGSRVPGIVRWPAEIKAGRVSDALVANPDMYRTFMEIGGAELPGHPLDGHNLLPLLRSQTEESPRNEYAYFYRGELAALRKGDWKLRLNGEQPQLFNLRLDVSERYNRAKDKPEIVRQLRGRMQELAGEVGVEVAGRR